MQTHNEGDPPHIRPVNLHIEYFTTRCILLNIEASIIVYNKKIVLKSEYRLCGKIIKLQYHSNQQVVGHPNIVHIKNIETQHLYL